MGIESGATFSADRRCRYRLWRVWDRTKPRVCFVCLNPSTADEDEDDTTVSICREFAVRWGYGALEVVNLFAFMATDPAVMLAARNPIGGPNNTAHILRACREADRIVVAWGDAGTHMNQAAAVLPLIRAIKPVYCLRQNTSGQPHHPLYIAWDTQPVLYQGP